MVLWMLAIPLLRIRGLLRPPFTVHLAYRGAIVSDCNRVYKVALGKKSTIALEYRNSARARRLWPQLATILPAIESNDGWIASYLSMNRYRPVGVEDGVRHAVLIYELIQTCRASGSQSMAIEDSAELASGIEVVTSLYGNSTSEIIRKHVESYLGSGDYHLGFAHGDFHSRNIMLDELGAHKLVDLDCVRFKGIQELDALYFVLEWEWSRSGKLYYSTIVDFLRGTVSTQCQEVLGKFGVRSSFTFAVTYLIDRIGQETNRFGFRFNRSILDPAIGAICTAQQVDEGVRPS